MCPSQRLGKLRQRLRLLFFDILHCFIQLGNNVGQRLLRRPHWFGQRSHGWPDAFAGVCKRNIEVWWKIVGEVLPSVVFLVSFDVFF